MHLDYERYRHHLTQYQLPSIREEEIMDYLWHFLTKQVDIAFDDFQPPKGGGQLDTDNLQSHNQTLH